jgi:hypothetical protein
MTQKPIHSTNLIILTIHTKRSLNGIELYLRAFNVNGWPFGEIYHFYFSHVEMEALASNLAKPFVETYMATKSHVIFLLVLKAKRFWSNCCVWHVLKIGCCHLYGLSN